ncbi:geminin [Diaphorina citri]|uniref:Geminin n=1 Tax=Diaphorina citri TaxID=121845 RepID=A0A1S3DK14_DIACI|nr:geminin [Diaphorina citri]
MNCKNLHDEMRDLALENEKSIKASTPSTKNKVDKSTTATVSLKDDLTSDVASEHYWKILAERRRVALEEALKENEALHNKVKLLEEENAVVKEMMKEATELVQTLTEIVEEKVEGDGDLDFSLNISK